MILYVLLLLITAGIAYFFGSLDTMVVASNFVFRTNLRRLGKGNTFLSNFKRVYGIVGALKLFAVELIKDLLPILLGGLLLGLKGHADVGRIFAGFCLVMGRLYPAFYGFRGGSAAFPMILTMIFASSSLGLAALVVFAILLFVTRYYSVATALDAGLMIVFGFLLLDVPVLARLNLILCLAVIVRHIPKIASVLTGSEERITIKNDLAYKFDQKF